MDTAKAETKAQAGDETSALTKKLEELEKELNGSREELETTKAGLDKANMELARAKEELKSALQTVEGTEVRGKARCDQRLLGQESHRTREH